MPVTDVDRHAFYWRTVIRDALRACPATKAAGLSVASIESLAMHAAVRVASELGATGQTTLADDAADAMALCLRPIPPPRTPEPA